MARRRRAVIAVIVLVMLGVPGWEQGTNDCTPQDLRTQPATDNADGSGKGVRGRAIVGQLRNLAQTTLTQRGSHEREQLDAHDGLSHNGSMEAKSDGTGSEGAALDTQTTSSFVSTTTRILYHLPLRFPATCDPAQAFFDSLSSSTCCSQQCPSQRREDDTALAHHHVQRSAGKTYPPHGGSTPACRRGILSEERFSKHRKGAEIDATPRSCRSTTSGIHPSPVILMSGMDTDGLRAPSRIGESATRPRIRISTADLQNNCTSSTAHAYANFLIGKLEDVDIEEGYWYIGVPYTFHLPPFPLHHPLPFYTDTIPSHHYQGCCGHSPSPLDSHLSRAQSINVRCTPSEYRHPVSSEPGIWILYDLTSRTLEDIEATARRSTSHDQATIAGAQNDRTTGRPKLTTSSKSKEKHQT